MNILIAVMLVSLYLALRSEATPNEFGFYSGLFVFSLLKLKSDFPLLIILVVSVVFAYCMKSKGFETKVKRGL